MIFLTVNYVCWRLLHCVFVLTIQNHPSHGLMLYLCQDINAGRADSVGWRGVMFILSVSLPRSLLHTVSVTLYYSLLCIGVGVRVSVSACVRTHAHRCLSHISWCSIHRDVHILTRKQDGALIPCLLVENSVSAKQTYANTCVRETIHATHTNWLSQQPSLCIYIYKIVHTYINTYNIYIHVYCDA